MNRQTVRLLILIALSILFIVLIGLAGRLDYEDEQKHFAYYCKMVRIFNDTQGQFGHPDYEKLYKLCPDK